jgi:hypothetical protein
MRGGGDGGQGRASQSRPWIPGADGVPRLFLASSKNRDSLYLPLLMALADAYQLLLSLSLSLSPLSREKYGRFSLSGQTSALTNAHDACLLIFLIGFLLLLSLPLTISYHYSYQSFFCGKICGSETTQGKQHPLGQNNQSYSHNSRLFKDI